MKKNEYLLKHQNTDVCFFRVNNASFDVEALELIDSKFFPANLKSTKELIAISFNNWLGSRCIPNSREGIEWIREKYNINSMKELMLAGDGLSLSDHYWIQKKGDIKKWEEINYYDNGYSDELGKALFNYKYIIGKKINESPDAALNGALRKRWVYNKKDKKSYLYKIGSERFEQEPFNEYFATILLKKLNIKCVEYKLEKENGKYVSSCPCGADNKTELVSADDIVRKYGIKKNYEEYIKLGEKRGITGFRDDINKMIAFDYIVRNTDRHWSNFGIVRDGKTGHWIEPTDIYDNGSILWNNDVIMKGESHSSSFGSTNEECLKYIELGKYIKRLPDMVKLFDEVFKEYNGDNERKIRKEKIRICLKERVKEIQKIINKDIGKIRAEPVKMARK